MTKDELLTRMIHLYGFESPITIQFARLMERDVDINVLRTLVKAHEERPMLDEEEDF